MINTLEYSQELIAVGFTPEQAKVQANTLNKAFQEKIATKHDLEKTEKDFIHALSGTEKRLDKKINDLDIKITRVEGDLKLVKWMLALVIIVEIIPYLKAFLGS